MRQAVTDNKKPIPSQIQTLLPESRKMRGYVMGGLIPLIVYLDGNDYKDSKICDRYFEFLAEELSPEYLKINGKMRLFAKSTKGSVALGEFCEKLLQYLNEQYGIERDNPTVNSDEHKKFRDEIYSFFPEYEDWIDYCVKLKYISYENIRRG